MQTSVKITMPSIDELNEEYKRLIKNPDFKYWRAIHIKNLSYYLGEQFIESSSLKSLLKRGIRSTDFNIIAPILHTLLGLELQTSYDINVQISSNDEEARECEL